MSASDPAGAQLLAPTLAQLVDAAVEAHGDLAAVADGDFEATFAELAGIIDTTAAALVASGLDPGDRVALWAPNTWEWVVAAFATFRAGGVLVPVNTRFRGREAAFVIARSRAKVLFTVNGFLDTDYVAMLDGAGEALPDLRHRVILRGEEAPGTVSCDEFVERGRAGGESALDAVRARSAHVAPHDMGLVMFTSGTTGLPKGVMIGHEPLLRMSTVYGHCMGLQREERFLVVTPFFHAFGFNGGIVPCFVYGATVLPHPVFDAGAVLDRIEAEQVNVLPGPPALFQGLLNHPDLDKRDVSSLRRCVTGAASIPVEMVVAMRERLGFETVITAYGMTETTGLASICRPGDDAVTIATTSGRAAPGMELAVVDDDGRERPRGEPGELWVRGPLVMQGYLDDPEQTAATIDADGWLHTGDIAVMDERGYIDITDRKKDMFIVGGFNAYPAEIERMMIAHPAVGQVAVIGMPDDRLGEVGAAFVVPAAGESVDPEELIGWCREEMANYKVPRRIWVVDALPLNASGKVLKTDLRAMAADRTSAG